MAKTPEDTCVLTGRGFRAEFDSANGSLRALRREEGTPPLLRSDDAGLWRARFRDGTEVRASDFSAGDGARTFRCREDSRAGALRMEYRSKEILVYVTVRRRGDGLELASEVRPAAKEVLEFALPARLRFDGEKVRRFVCPMDGNQGVGAAFTRAFFLPQPEDRPTAWRQEAVGTAGYAALYGGPLDQRADQDPAVSLRVTPEGARRLGEGLAARLGQAKATVNRPPTRGQADLVLVDSPNGPWLSAKRLGEGALWRIGGAVGEAERGLALDSLAAVVEGLAAAPPPGRAKIGVLAMRNGPEQGGWAAVPVRAWLERLRRLPTARSSVLQVVEIATPGEMAAALASGAFLAILNPYGEWSPVIEGGMPATVEAVGRYARTGGNWFETGGYPFFYALQPVRHFAFSGRYPALFADFLHLDSTAGTVGLYRAQLPSRPWEGATNRPALFVPGTLGCGSDPAGGYADRAYATFVAPGGTWRAPATRLAVGRTAEADLRDYARANGIQRRLAEKMPGPTLEKMKRAVLLYYAGSAREKAANLERLPVPTLVHWADYLRGGFDKQYPDHLPPNPAFGTPEELRDFMARARSLGHLVMPYTNPTWWCDHPKGPTFEREGDAPLLRTLDGKLSYERYGVNDGWTVTHWHPAVQAANRRTRKQFTGEYPVDILFQDQNGARSWQYDANPASPTPYAYTDGLLSQAEEDSRVVPLSTESGWDRVVNAESQLCGMTWGLVPTEYAPEWRRLMKTVYPPDTWTVYPLAQRLAHDKTVMLHHDLGQFVTNREVLAWTLGLGFSLSYRVGAAQLAEGGAREWLAWLDRLQKSVCARYVGEPVRAFDHDRGSEPTVEDDGVLRAQYGPVRVTANVGPSARAEAGREIAPYGFVATAPGMLAANVRRLGGLDFGEEGLSFVTEVGRKRADVWVYAPSGQEVCVELPARAPGAAVLAFDGGATARARADGRLLRFRLPAPPDGERTAPPPALAGKAPRDWPGTRPAVGVLDLPNAPAPMWTRVGPTDWLRAFSESRLAREWGVPVKPIQSVEALYAALEAGPTAWLAIVNPYGEAVPAPGPGRWRETLERLRRYVEAGGSWWETGGYSFHQAFAPDGTVESAGPAALASLGLPIGGGEVEAPAEPLRATAEGREWVGADLARKLEGLQSTANRALPRGPEDPGHLTLVTGGGKDFLGGYRLRGWGWLWRTGGFWPEPQAMVPAVVAATEYLYTHPPLPPDAGGAKRLWHAVAQW